jgi:hypothetical protein
MVFRLEDEDVEQSKHLVKDNFSFSGTANADEDYVVTYEFYSYCALINISIVQKPNLDVVFDESKNIDLSINFPTYKELNVHIELSWYKPALKVIDGSFALRIEDHIVVGLNEGYD